MKKLNAMIGNQLLLLTFLLLSTFCAAQSSISGIVLDDVGEPLIGAAIYAEGTSIGTVTDIDGSFNLNMPKDNNMLIVWILLFVFVNGIGQLIYWIVEILGKRKGDVIEG